MKLRVVFLFLGLAVPTTHAFVVPTTTTTPSGSITITTALSSSSIRNDDAEEQPDSNNHRRAALARLMMLSSGAAAAAAAGVGLPLAAVAEESIFAPKFVQEYPDFAMADEGWSFREVKVGDGASPNWGDRVVFDWSGYTIGYFGRPFEAKGCVQ
jgi:hypothetical protein